MTAGIRCDVLVVEDDPVQCEELADFLHRAGVVVERAFDGSTALRRASSLTPRVVLLDHNLPDMTGVELAEQMRALLPAAAILMMSGRLDGVSEKTLLEFGITVFLNKPVPVGPLREAVLKLVRADPGEQVAKVRPTGWLAAGVGGTRR